MDTDSSSGRIPPFIEAIITMARDRETVSSITPRIQALAEASGKRGYCRDKANILSLKGKFTSASGIKENLQG